MTGAANKQDICKYKHSGAHTGNSPASASENKRLN